MIVNKKSLKILHILDHSLPIHTGYTFRSQDIFRVQQKMGWQPVVLTSPKHEESWKDKSGEKEVIGGITYYRTGPLSEGTTSLRSAAQLMAMLAKRVREVVEIEKPDLIHAHSPILNSIPVLWLRRELKIPVIYEIRAFWEDAAVDHGTYRANSWRYKLVRSAETWVCRKADWVVVLSEGLKEDLIKRGIPKDKLDVTPNGVNVEDFKVCKPDDAYIQSWKVKGKKVIGFIGSFYRYEGLDLLVDAFARLSENRPDSVLLLVGGGVMEEELRAQVKRLGLGDKVIMPGRIPHEAIPGIYTLVDVLAYPRYSARLTELVTPLKPLEAMAIGKALVASDVGGHRELIRNGKTGLLFEAGDVSALAETLELLLNDDGLRKNLEKQAELWVRQERSWDKTTAVYSSVYAKALGLDLARHSINGR